MADQERHGTTGHDLQSLAHGVTIPSPITEMSASVLRVQDTCNVYVLRRGGDAVVIDFGSGRVLDHLDELGVERITDVLVTHHHRDQVQVLARAVDAGGVWWCRRVDLEPIAGAASTLAPAEPRVTTTCCG